MQPWIRGPFELLRHANGHLLDGGDIDRRLALIGFDNAIEVCIDVFIRLHPRLRGGLQVPKEEMERALQTYHSKIEFLDKYIERVPEPPAVPIESIVWFHQLRNELYHSGHGMVPELHALAGARDAAIKVFSALFNVDVSPILGASPEPHKAESRGTYMASENAQMEFLRVFIDFERALTEFLEASHPAIAKSLRSVRDMWHRYRTEYPTTAEWDALVERAIDIRDAIVHGRQPDLDPDVILTTVIELIGIIANLEDRT